MVRHPPDGAGFLSFGLNHTNTDYFKQSYNIDFWKSRFGELLRGHYPAIGDCNRVYHTSFSSFEQLRNARDWSPVVQTAAIDDARDNRAFPLKILERHDTVACAAVLGCRDPVVLPA